MTPRRLVRLVAVIGGALAGAAMGPSLGLLPLVGAGLGLLAGALAISLEACLDTVSTQTLAWTSIGLAAGLFIGFTLGAVIAPVAGAAGPALWSALPLLGAWVGGVVAARREAELPLDTHPGIAGIAEAVQTGNMLGADECAENIWNALPEDAIAHPVLLFGEAVGVTT